LPQRIADLESEQASLHARLADPALYQNASGEVIGLKERLDVIEVELEHAMARWVDLESRSGN
jgi:ABC transport system ATP-binding/permease protein